MSFKILSVLQMYRGPMSAWLHRRSLRDKSQHGVQKEHVVAMDNSKMKHTVTDTQPHSDTLQHPPPPPATNPSSVIITTKWPFDLSQPLDSWGSGLLSWWQSKRAISLHPRNFDSCFHMNLFSEEKHSESAISTLALALAQGGSPEMNSLNSSWCCLFVSCYFPANH